MRIRRHGAWLIRRSYFKDWYALAPNALWAARTFPSWREAYDYAHTHPSNRKETTT